MELISKNIAKDKLKELTNEDDLAIVIDSNTEMQEALGKHLPRMNLEKTQVVLRDDLKIHLEEIRQMMALVESGRRMQKKNRASNRREWRQIVAKPVLRYSSSAHFIGILKKKMYLYRTSLKTVKQSNIGRSDTISERRYNPITLKIYIKH